MTQGYSTCLDGLESNGVVDLLGNGPCLFRFILGGFWVFVRMLCLGIILF